MYAAQLRWDKFLSGDPTQGDLGQSLVSGWISINDREFSIQLNNAAAASPQGTWSFEVTSDGGAHANVLDTSLLVPSPTNPDGTTTPQSQTLSFPSALGHQVRVKYTRVGGGGADAATGRVTVR